VPYLPLWFSLARVVVNISPGAGLGFRVPRCRVRDARFSDSVYGVARSLSLSLSLSLPFFLSPHSGPTADARPRLRNAAFQLWLELCPFPFLADAYRVRGKETEFLFSVSIPSEYLVPVRIRISTSIQPLCTLCKPTSKFQIPLPHASIHISPFCLG
jgi:hypothetical protein